MATINNRVYANLASKHLGSLIGQRAEAFGALWCEKAEELSVTQANSDICALRALRECMKEFHVELSVLHQQLLMEDFGDALLCGAEL
ncbi:hypothetical protein P4B35_11870 [Pontiellaceae bacterium B12227]|nr:hypothetical protein [Pontiellaceae bacterium B12227]